jgi:hypothetical protein
MPLPTTFAGVSARGEGLFRILATGPVTGSHVYTIPATYTWTCPAGVTSVSVVCIGGGDSGETGSSTYGGQISYFNSSSYLVADGGAYAGGNGGGTAATAFYVGGLQTSSNAAYGNGGSGAAGYSSAGGSGGHLANGTSSSIDGGGGGGSSSGGSNGGAGGAGTDLYGSDTGAHITGGAQGTSSSVAQGGGTSTTANSGGVGGYGTSSTYNGSNGLPNQYGYGSPGAGKAGYTRSFKGSTTYFAGGGGGGAFGGGGGTGGYTYTLSNMQGGGLAYGNNLSVTPGNTYTVVVGAGGVSPDAYSGDGGGGGVRIVWPGLTRQFPSTSVSTITNEVYN